MFTRKRIVPITLSGDWAVDGPELVKWICDYHLSLEAKGAVTLAEADGEFQTLKTWTTLEPISPVDGYPQGNDLVLRSRGPADTYLEQLKAYTTTATNLSVGSNSNILVAAVSVGNSTRGVVQSGTTALLSTNASLIVGRETANEEVVASGSWSIVDGTHITLTCAKTHSGTTDIEQIGALFVSAANVMINSDALDAAQNSTRSAPMRVYDADINPIVYLPAKVGDTWPYGAVRWNAIQTGANGSNADHILRHNTSSSVWKILNAANTETAASVNDNGDLVMAGGLQSSGPATLPAAFSSPIISWENPVTRFYFGTGGGYELRFSKRTGSTTTDMATLSDAGSLTLVGALTVGTSTLMFTSVALTNGAGAGVGTLNNGPANGDPTKWIPINDNGTTRYIPAW